MDTPSASTPSTDGRGRGSKKRGGAKSSSSAAPRDGRVRAVIACERCKTRRIKCDAQPTCGQCAKAGRECEYKGTERRVWVTQHTFLELERSKAELQLRCEQLEHRLRQLDAGSGTATQNSADVQSKDQALQHTGIKLSPRSTCSVAQPSPSPPPLQPNLQGHVQGVPSAPTLMTDPQGRARYMGSCAGASFHDALWEAIWRSLPSQVSSIMPALPLHSYHTSDSRPILLATSDPLFLPPLFEVKHLINMFFATCTDPLFWMSRSDFEAKVNSFYRNGVTTDDRWHLCLLYIVLALGAEHSAGSTRTGDTLPGMEYFAKAKLLLFNFCEESSIVCIQALALVAYFLLSAHRRDAAYAYIGLAIRICVALGLHRNLPHPDAGVDKIVEEQHRRLFWSVYCLDRIICAALGRSTQISDAEILVGPAVDLPGFFPAITVNRFVELSRISGEITSKLYISSGSTETYSAGAAMEILEKLDQWRANEPSDEEYGFRLARTMYMLDLMHHLLVNIATRSAFLHTIGGTAVMFPAHMATAQDQRECIEMLQQRAITAAKASALDLEHLVTTSSISPWSFFELHHAYNAGVIVILARMLGLDADSDQRNNQELHVCQEILSIMAAAGNESAASCQSILSTLELVATRFAKRRDLHRFSTSGQAPSPYNLPSNDAPSAMKLTSPPSTSSPSTEVDPLSPEAAQQLMDALRHTTQSLERENSWAASLAPASLIDPAAHVKENGVGPLLYPGVGTREAFPHLHPQAQNHAQRAQIPPMRATGVLGHSQERGPLPSPMNGLMMPGPARHPPQHFAAQGGPLPSVSMHEAHSAPRYYPDADANGSNAIPPPPRGQYLSRGAPQNHQSAYTQHPMIDQHYQSALLANALPPPVGFSESYITYF